MSSSQEDNRRKRRSFRVDEYIEGVLGGDRTILAQTITLVESNAKSHRQKALEVLRGLMPHTGHSMRVGVTGVPGVGKSTFIDTLGSYLTARGSKVAVLAVDPSSTITGGSILGDKTRMDALAADPNAFIRPSPTGGTLGGVARKSRETLLVCEAAGFDVVFVETVGVGQSEVTVRSMVDFFLLMMISGAGDELQGIKRGIMELADALIINKADGENIEKAEVARGEYDRALHYLMPATAGWQTRAHTCSAKEGRGIEESWKVIETFRKLTHQSGSFQKRRETQVLEWFHAMIGDSLKDDFFSHPKVSAEIPNLQKSVLAGEVPAIEAVEHLLGIFRK